MRPLRICLGSTRQTRPAPLPEVLEDCGMTQRQLTEHLISLGWTVHRNGWPDLLAFRGGRVLGIEIKPSRIEIRRARSRSQITILSILARIGMETFIWQSNAGQLYAVNTKGKLRRVGRRYLRSLLRPVKLPRPIILYPRSILSLL